MKAIFTIVLLAVSIDLSFSADVRSYLPEGDEIPGWIQDETTICRTRNDMFDYMNGGAELYFSFNFKRLAVRTFVNEDDVDLVIEIYLFKNDFDAYGMFSMLPVDEKLSLGDGGSFSVGVLRFWKGPYYCKIYLTGDYERHNSVIKAASEVVNGKIDAQGVPPKLITLMPETDRKREGLHYFHDHIAQKNLYYVSTSNLFDLSLKTNVVMGEYLSIAAEEAYLFLIEYPDSNKCRTVFEGAINSLFEDAPDKLTGNSYSALTSDHRWCEMHVEENYFLIGFSSNDSDYLGRRMAELKQKLAGYGGE
ncbi:MAG: hypothetical protein H8E46_06280 [FCB group bacterium]|nr:hypothetical protein [FCB group bacterium]